MPGQFIMPHGSGGMLDSYYHAAPLWDETMLHKAANNWDYQRRSVQSTWDANRWDSLWPRGYLLDTAMAYPGILGSCCEGSQGLAFEPSTAHGGGTQTLKFLKGTTFDANGAPLANAVVQGFVTATEVYVGQVISAADGTYILPTSFGTVQHYIVAYKAGSPDVAGTSANTLVPTNIDGS